MFKKTFLYAICSGLLGLIVCGPSSAVAAYSAIYDVAWVSVLERDAPSVDEPIWITHAGSGELEVKIDGEVMAPVEEQEYYSRYQPPSNAPGTHTIEVTLYSEPGKIERQVEGDFTTISSAPEDDTDISLRRWRDLEDSPPPHCKGYTMGHCKSTSPGCLSKWCATRTSPSSRAVMLPRFAPKSKPSRLT